MVWHYGCGWEDVVGGGFLWVGCRVVENFFFFLGGVPRIMVGHSWVGVGGVIGGDWITRVHLIGFTECGIYRWIKNTKTVFCMHAVFHNR